MGSRHGCRPILLFRPRQSVLRNQNGPGFLSGQKVSTRQIFSATTITLTPDFATVIFVLLLQYLIGTHLTTFNQGLDYRYEEPYYSYLFLRKWLLN